MDFEDTILIFETGAKGKIEVKRQEARKVPATNKGYRLVCLGGPVRPCRRLSTNSYVNSRDKKFNSARGATMPPEKTILQQLSFGSLRPRRFCPSKQREETYAETWTHPSFLKQFVRLPSRRWMAIFSLDCWAE